MYSRAINRMYLTILAILPAVQTISPPKWIRGSLRGFHKPSPLEAFGTWRLRDILQDHPIPVAK